MKSNGLLKWLLIPITLLVIFVSVRLCSGSQERGAHSEKDPASELTAGEMKSLGIEADTPQDTVATLVAQVKELRTELKSALEENKQQKADNQRLRQRESAIDQRIQSALDAERDRSRQDREQTERDQEQMRRLLQDLQHQLDGSASAHADLPVGLGLREDDADALPDSTRTHWVEPQDAKPADKKQSAARPTTSSVAVYPTSFAPATEETYDVKPDKDVPQEKLNEAGSVRPVYTGPDNATLIGSVSMTALVGRVPIDGTVHDPYRFKVIIGPDNLIANGFELPDLAGAIASGTASGDWTLSCVRGQIRSLTFVFQDGTIRTLSASSSARSTGGIEGGLGWISDQYGIPCVSGERRSNAQQFLASQALITAAGAGAASLIKSDRGGTAFVTRDGNVLGTVGISGEEAVGRIIAAGVQDVSEWVKKLYGQAFPAIYVQPGAPVAVHIEQPLEIDYDSAGRKVDHTQGANHVSNLD